MNKTIPNPFYEKKKKSDKKDTPAPKPAETGKNDKGDEPATVEAPKPDA